MRHLSAVSFATLGAVSMALAACGGGTTVSSGSTNGSTNGRSATTVVLKNVAFNPGNVTVKAGQSVTWVWKDDGTYHNVDFKSLFKTAIQDKGTYTYTFSSPGTYHYLCDVHPYMTGTVAVTP